MPHPEQASHAIRCRYVGFGRGRSCTLRGSSTAALAPVYSSSLDDTTSVILLSISPPLEFLVFCTLLRFAGGFDPVVFFPSPGFFRLPFALFAFFLEGCSCSDKDSALSLGS